MRPDIVADKTTRAPKQPFNLRRFRRILSLTWPFRRALALGLILTLIFAALHTFSIGGVFPIFKILLEEEGVRGWAHRTVAADRTGVEFAPVENVASSSLRVSSVDSDHDAFEQGLRSFDLISSAQLPTAGAMLEQMANADVGQVIEVVIEEVAIEDATASSDGFPRVVRLTVGEVSTQSWALLRLAGMVKGETAKDKLGALITILIGLSILVAFANTLRYLGEIMIARAILRGMMTLRAQLYERTLQLPMTFFAGQQTGDIVTRFVQDVLEIQNGLMTFFGKFIREPMRAAFLLTAAFLLDWRITLVVVMVAPVAVTVFYVVGRKVKTANEKLLRGYGRMLDALTVSLQNIRVVKAYTAEEKERAHLSTVDWSMFAQQIKLAKLQAFISPALETTAVIAGGMVTVWLANLVLGHELSVSKFVTLGFVLSVLSDPLRKLSDVYVRIQRSTAGADRIFQVIDSPIESSDDGEGVELSELAGSIDYDNVTFSYEGADVPAVAGVTISIKKGETVAIVGPNGCGKTTLMSLLPRFFDPQEGSVLFDGVAIRKATLGSLRKQISLVTQEAVVFAASPIENIAYGGGEIDEERAKDAARRAHADDFIEKLPESWNTVLGERGTSLSGGQRQRLAIARAIYRDAPILIFDEATSQVDSESELKIQTAIREFSKGRTTLIIAHRLSTIQFANRIIVMEAGRVIDEGEHADLMGRCSLYRTLCETQLVSGVG